MRGERAAGCLLAQGAVIHTETTQQSLSCSLYCTGPAVLGSGQDAEERGALLLRVPLAQVLQLQLPQRPATLHAIRQPAAGEGEVGWAQLIPRTLLGPPRLGKLHLAGPRPPPQPLWLGASRGSGVGSAAGSRMFTLQLERLRRDRGPGTRQDGGTERRGGPLTSAPAAAPASRRRPSRRTASWCHAAACSLSTRAPSARTGCQGPAPRSPRTGGWPAPCSPVASPAAPAPSSPARPPPRPAPPGGPSSSTPSPGTARRAWG